jgi:hypothetical protein
MRTIHLNASDPAARQITNVAFNYSGRKFKACVVNAGHKFTLNSMWDGGSRDYYAVVKLSTMESIDVSDMVGSYTREDKTLKLQAGFALVEHSFFCGKDAGITIYILEENAAKLIPAPVELTADERKVLNHGRRMKAESGLTDSTWNAAEAVLLTKGLITKAGVRTAAGKNVVYAAMSL